jgi:hypothetical protein
LRYFVRRLLVGCLLGGLPVRAPGYSVLTHELLIDVTWKTRLEPLLSLRFPGVTAAQLQEAHSYAYGGCVIQDLGYYPFANEFFSNLTHYVRSGDFVMALLRNSRDVDEYAFALGALSHYFGDNIGHHDAVNPATAIGFPKLEKKYGPVVTYDDNPHAHVRVEFAFDVDEASRARIAPGAYLRFIGLRVASRLLAQTFEETYSLPLTKVIGPHRPAFRSYHSSVRGFLPRVAYAETTLHRNKFPPEGEDRSVKEFLDLLSQADFQNVWKSYRKKPGLETRFFALLIRIVPKVGVLSEVAIKIPTARTQDLYMRSVNRTAAAYGDMLKELSTTSRRPSVPKTDLDTGEKTVPGSYALTDATYAKLLHILISHEARPIVPEVRENILAYYSDQRAKSSASVEADLAALRGMK